jgi:hypothetical protein
MSQKVVLPLLLIVAAPLSLGGCAKPVGYSGPSSQVSAANHTHDGWWCDEHGVPEEVCALCNIKLVADFKAKGDWCQQHDRPDSQCFTCHPEKQAEFAAQYEAKYGVKPPKTQTE